MPEIPNDEPNIPDDQLGHFPLVRQLGHMMIDCNPPYVIGICGSWGSGKTSFLRKLWACLGGDFEASGSNEKQRADSRKAKRMAWLEADCKHFEDSTQNWDVVWFNPWHHQFETSPLVALLYEIRQHFCLSQKVLGEAGKLVNVATYSALNMLTEIGKTIHVPLPNAKDVMEYGTKYEAERFSTPLSSQRFRDFFEEAIEQALKPKQNKGTGARLIIFIDDLDRCEGDVAYRLLESLKLYLNAKNCIYVLGLDLEHLEETIARTLAGGGEIWQYRPRARNYLNKMFQNLFLLPVRKSMTEYIRTVLDPDEILRELLQTQFGMASNEWPGAIVDTINSNLPHNPRKIKSFIAAWKLNLNLLARHAPQHTGFNWRLTLVLNYLGQFEEPLFRKVEEAPGFYSDQIVPFCRAGRSASPLFDGLELPYGTQQSTAEATGGLDSGPSGTPQTSDNREDTGAKPSPSPRIFWIARLVNHLGVVMPGIIEEHLLGTGGLTSQAQP